MRKIENWLRDLWVIGIWIYDLIYGLMINKNGVYGGFFYYVYNIIDYCFILWVVNLIIYMYLIDMYLFCLILV